MAATAEQIARLRRMVAEPTSATYADADIAAYIESYPVLDEMGEAPYELDVSTIPPHQDANTEWIPTYDLHAAAGDIWEEKASAVSAYFDFQADGGNFSRSQLYEQAQKQARYHRSRRTPKTSRLVVWPEIGELEQSWIGNLAEPRD